LIVIIAVVALIALIGLGGGILIYLRSRKKEGKGSSREADSAGVS